MKEQKHLVELFQDAHKWVQFLVELVVYKWSLRLISNVLENHLHLFQHQTMQMVL